VYACAVGFSKIQACGYPKIETYLCGSLRNFAFSALKGYFNADVAEVRRGSQRILKLGKKLVQRHSVAEKIFHKLAKVFNGLHWGIGITTLPTTATSREERSFVLMWLGIIAFMVLFFAALLYLLGTI
jgi:hypothetical protein